jgi:chromosome transmission fidelity protein 4
LPEAVITHLAFSPSQNLVAWTDLDGVLTRWPDAIPSSSPDPVKPPASNVSATVQVKRKTSPTLFGDDAADSGLHDVDLDADLGLDNDDWIIDDVGMLDGDNGHGKRSGDGFTKEMGLFLLGILTIEYYSEEIVGQ